jgi:branched-chain amino acid aminotransferase
MAAMAADSEDPQLGEALLACLDGELMPSDRAQISVTDEGLLRGDGVFEVARLYAGVPFALQEHLDRMERSARNLLLPIDRASLERDVRSLLAAQDAGDRLLRLLVTRGGRRIVLLERLPEIASSIALAYVVYSPTVVLDGAKSLSYAANMLAGRLARQRGFDEALLVSPEGRVLEAPTASFFWVRDGQLLTPPLDDHVLDSITRRLIISCSQAREAPVQVDELAGAQEAFIASSVREVLPAHRIEDLRLPECGPLTAEVAAKVRGEIAQRLAQERL